MANYDVFYANQAAQRTALFEKAFTAFSSLQQETLYGGILGHPEIFSMETLHFDPGVPERILLNIPGNIQNLFDRVDDLITSINNITTPVIPDIPNIKMEDHEIWDEAFMDKIETSLSTYVDTMGIPDISYQNTIFNEHYERNLTTLNDLMSLADAKTGAKGFSYPNDWGGAQKIEAQVKYQYDRIQISRDITKLVTEWARQNYQFAIEKGLTQQQAHMDFTYKYCTASLEIYKNLIVAILEAYKARIEVVSAPITLLAKELDMFMEYAKVSAEIDKTNETLKQSRSDLEIKEALQKYGTDVQFISNTYNTRMQSLQTVANDTGQLATSVSSLIVGNPSS